LLVCLACLWKAFLFFVIQCFRHFTITLFSFKFRFLFQRLNFIKCNKYFELWIVLLVSRNFWNTAKCHANFIYICFMICMLWDMYVMRLSIGRVSHNFAPVASHILKIWQKSYISNIYLITNLVRFQHFPCSRTKEVAGMWTELCTKITLQRFSLKWNMRE
jgi:hypothetical protein